MTFQNSQTPRAEKFDFWMETPEAKVPAFLLKLYEMVQDKSNDEYIHWNTNNSFVVRKEQEFSKKVLPMYFKHSNFTSFIRQLNMYGFHKMVQIKGDLLEFKNEYFQKDRKDLLGMVSRKKKDSLDIHTILQELNVIKEQHFNMQQELQMIKQNEDIMNVNYQMLVVKNQQQKQIIDKILEFLNSVFGKRKLDFSSVANSLNNVNNPIKKQKLIKGTYCVWPHFNRFCHENRTNL